MTRTIRLASRHSFGLAIGGLALLAVCGGARAQDEPAHSAELDAAIIKQAKRNGVPEKLVRRIVMRESKYNARARNHSFWGLMQISYPTAKSMGFKGTPDQLLNPFVNLTYAVPYLANAFVIAGKKEDAAVRLYASGYYATAKSRGLLSALRTAETAPVSGETETPMMAMADPTAQPAPQSFGVFGALFGPGHQAQPDPATQVASVDPQAAGASVAPAAAALPQGKDDVDAVAMTTDKAGNPQPPKKWLKDGGLSTIVRGEQRIEQVAAYEHPAGPEPSKSHAKSHKTTTFAALDQPPATAQAYAGAADAQDPRLAQSQAAIDQATSGQGSAGQPMSAQGAADPQAQAQPVAGTQAAPADDKPKKKVRVAHKGHAAKIADATDGDTAKASKSKHAAAKKAKIAAGEADDGRIVPQPVQAATQ